MTTTSKLRILNSAIVYSVLGYAIYTEENGEFQRLYCVLAIVTGFIGRRLTNCVLEGEANSLKLDVLTTNGEKTEELSRYLESDSNVGIFEFVFSYILFSYACYKLFF